MIYLQNKMFWNKNQKINTDPQKIDELLTRGVENVFPNKAFLESELKKGNKLTFYLGIDPTGSTLHLGHVIPLKKLAKLQELGHQIILLMGDITAMIGDPTDKSAVRKKLTHEQVMENLKEYKKQASRFVSFEGQNPALFKFNSEWFGKMSFIDSLELASNATVDQMMKRDMFQRRKQEGKETYIHELIYPLMQGYDSVAMNVDGEVGGNDQTFNMLTGRDLLKTLKQKEKFVIATKLLTDSAGKKMGKTENNMVSLNQSPEEMFGAVMSWSDELIIPGFEIVTDISLSEIENIKSALASGENPKNFKMRLAEEIVTMCHNLKAAKAAKENFEKTFSKGEIPENVLEVKVSQELFLVDIFLEQGIVESKTEFRRLVNQGSITNLSTKEKVSDPWTAQAIAGTYRVGSKRFIKVKN